MTCKTRPEALRLADECEESAQVWAHEIDTRKRAAAELRRLHVQYAQDEALLRQALDALAYWLEHGETPGSHDIIQRTHDVLQERLK